MNRYEKQAAALGNLSTTFIATNLCRKLEQKFVLLSWWKVEKKRAKLLAWGLLQQVLAYHNLLNDDSNLYRREVLFKTSKDLWNLHDCDESN